MVDAPLSDADYERIRRFIHGAAGIRLTAAKHAMVCSRLARRLHAHGLDDYGRYLDLLESGVHPAEAQVAVDLLTTNETYFFREPRHFDLLRSLAREARAGRRPLRAWSAACSSGEEAYGMAMVLDDMLGPLPWEVTGTDISRRVLQRARAGHYADERTRHLPADYRRRYCLRGTGEYEGTLLVRRELRARVRFLQANLNEPLPALGPFDVAFLRNVMIYFDTQTRQAVVGRVLDQLVPGGVLCIGHAETLQGIADAVEPVAPAAYRKR